MSHRDAPRRGLGRGLGSLIPTAPRHEVEEAHDATRQEAREGSVPDHSPSEKPLSATTLLVGAPAPGSADWIGVPLPGDRALLVEPPPDTDPASQGDRGTAAAEGQGVTDGAGPDASRPDTGLVASPGSESPGDAFPESDAVTAGSEAERPEPQSREPSSSAVAQAEGGAWFAELPVDEIRPNPRQPREVFDEEAMTELVASIGEVGLLQPVVVRPVDQGYELVMGERRWRAVRKAGLSTIPAIVRETADHDLLRDALLENLHRAELNALEEAAAYQQLLEDFGCTHDELASRIGRSRPQISNTIRLLKLSPAVQRRVAAGVLSAGHARALLGVEDPALQDRLAARVVAEGISVRGLEEIVAVGELGAPAAPARRNRPTAPGVEDLAAQLSDHLETRVRVDLGTRKGRITVEFASLPDLERIVGLIDPGHRPRGWLVDPRP
jgi:ParB family chromosome partitioning protein